MIFSQWNPGGGYKYYETAHEHPIGDDVPSTVPSMVNNIGVPSSMVGVTLPRGAAFVGEGDHPMGVMVPAKVGGYRPLGEQSAHEKQTSMIVVALFVTGVTLMAGLFRDGRH